MTLASTSIVHMTCLSGLLISLYAVYLKFKIIEDPNYVALCDINESVSCTRVLENDYGHFFSKVGLVPANSSLDYSNALFGSIYYVLMWILLTFARNLKGTRYIAATFSTLAFVFSIILAYIMITEIQILCLLCLCSYVCNSILFYLSIGEVVKTKKI